MPEHEINQANVGVTVVIGDNRWGKGQTVFEAKANFKKQGGRLSHGYSVLEFADEVEFTGVDQMGYVHWRRTDGKPASDDGPKVTEHPPKG